MTIGSLGAGEGHDVSDVRSAAVLDDGTIVVASTDTHDVRLFSADGTFVRSFGREGDGPGDFRGALGWIREISQDTLAAFDRGLRRITLFCPTGEPFRVATLPLPGDLFSSLVQPPFDDGSYLVVRHDAWGDRSRLRPGGRPKSGEGWPTSERIRYLRLRDSSIDTLVVVREDAVTVTYQAATLVERPPLSPALLWAVGSEFFVVGFGGDDGLVVYGPDGIHMGTVRPSEGSRPVQARDRVAYERWYLDEGGAPGFRPVRQLLLDRAEWSTTMPLLDRVSVDREGLIWLGRFTLEGDVRLWHAYDRRGRLLGETRMPRRLAVLEIGTDYVLGKTAGEYDEELVVRYDLDRGGVDGRDGHFP